MAATARRRHRAARAGAVPAVVALTLGLTGCGSADEERCAELYSSVIGAVDGVTSVEVECAVRLSGGWQRIDVHLATDSPDDARVIGEEVLKAIASEPEMDPLWATPQDYFLENGEEVAIGLRDLGFNGVPRVDEVREQYDIEP